MNLPKQDIQFIDNYLKNSGVTLVDVRLEMVDHIASEIEAKLESEEEDTFYDAFKSYMVRGKKSLLDDYEKQKLLTQEVVFYKVLKSFLDIKILVIGVLLYLIFTNMNIDIMRGYTIDVQVLVGFSFLALYFILFWKERKTSIGFALLSFAIVPIYLPYYFKNPLMLLVFIPFMIAVIKNQKKLYKKYKQKKASLIVIFLSVPLVVLMPVLDSYTSSFVTIEMQQMFFAFQVMFWCVIIKTFLKYKKEVNQKHRLLFE